METKLILELVIALVGVVPTVVSLIFYVVKMIKDKNWTAIMKLARDAMTTVETYSAEHPEMTGNDKQEMAITIVKQACAADNITLDEEALKNLIEYIKELIKWSKTVNVK